MILDDLDHLVFLLRYSLLIGRPTEASSHLSTDFLSIQNIISPFPLPSRPWGSWVRRASWGQEESSFRSHRGRRRGWRTWTRPPGPRAPCQRAGILIEGFQPDTRLTHWCRRSWPLCLRSRCQPPPSRGWYVLRQIQSPSMDRLFAHLSHRL